VKWLLAHPATRRDTYRDKYMKFVTSSHFPMNVGAPKETISVDQMLVFSDGKQEVARTMIQRGELLPDGIRSIYTIKLSEINFSVTTRIRLIGDFEEHTHEIEADHDLTARDIKVAEGSYPSCQPQATVAAWNIAGYSHVQSGEVLGGENLIYPKHTGTKLSAFLQARRTTLASLHYASTKPLPRQELEVRAKQVISTRESN
jgi:hypothetical protein